MNRALATAAVALGLVLAALTGAAGVAVTGDSAAGAFVRPLAGAVVTQEFGCTDVVVEIVDRHCPGGHWHSGIDLAAAAGTPVHAIAAGRVTVIISAFGYGLHVIIDHGNGLSSLYGHLLSVAVPDGAVVDAGEVIGALGSSGNSTGPHLHLEIRRDGIPENPRDDMQLP